MIFMTGNVDFEEIDDKCDDLTYAIINPTVNIMTSVTNVRSTS